MKGGVVLALGALRAFAKHPERYDELALLLVCDEEWRTADFSHVPRFAGFDAVPVLRGRRAARAATRASSSRRKAAGTIHVTGHGRTAHSGSAPDRGRNALLALATAAQAVAARHAPDGPSHLTAVPTVMRSGDAFNVVPGHGELFCDVRADDLDAIEDVLAHIPAEHNEVRLEAELIRRWPGMHSEEATRPLLETASALLGRTDRARRPRRRLRRQPLRRHRPDHGRRPRPARRQGAQPRGVRARSRRCSRAPRSRSR